LENFQNIFSQKLTFVSSACVFKILSTQKLGLEGKKAFFYPSERRKVIHQ